MERRIRLRSKLAKRLYNAMGRVDDRAVDFVKGTEP